MEGPVNELYRKLDVGRTLYRQIRNRIWRKKWTDLYMKQRKWSERTDISGNVEDRCVGSFEGYEIKT